MIERSHLRVRTLRILISELLSITAIETGNFELHRTGVDMVEIVREAVEAARERAAGKGIDLTLNELLPEKEKTALADREALLLVFSNLIDNAIKYTAEQGKVTVQVAQTDLYATVSVQDTGIGMTHPELDKVFDEFYRVKNEHTADIAGTGLGLSLVKRLIELHQGQINAESTPGKGSIFKVEVPLS